MKITKRNFNIAYIWSGFKDKFGEPEVKPKKWKAVSVDLLKAMTDQEILKEYKPKEITLDELAYLLESKEGMLINGYANIFYIDGRVVSASWGAGLGWGVDAGGVSSPNPWGAGDRVFSRNSFGTQTLNPSVPSDLESRVKSLEKEFCGDKTYFYFAKRPDKLKDFLRTALTSAYEKGKEEAVDMLENIVRDYAGKTPNEAIEDIIRRLQGEINK